MLFDRFTNACIELFDAMNNPVIITGAADEILFLNIAAGNLLGWSLKEIEGRKLDLIINLPPESKGYSEKNLWSGNGEFLLRSGSALKSGFLVAFMKDNNKATLGRIITIQTSTLSTNMVSDNNQEKVADGFPASSLVHGLRNPLGGISGYASLLQRRFESGDPRKRLANRIIDGVNSLDRMISDLLDFTRISKPSMESVNLWKTMEEALAYSDSEFDFTSSGIELNLQPPEFPVLIKADPYQVHNLLMHVIRNAVQAMPDGGILTASISLDKRAHVADVPVKRDYVRVEISDTGPGMEAEVKNRIFEVFFTTKDNSSGMGLAIAHRIVSCHGGYIDVQSSPGLGTTVTVAFPVSSENMMEHYDSTASEG